MRAAEREPSVEPPNYCAACGRIIATTHTMVTDSERYHLHCYIGSDHAV